MVEASFMKTKNLVVLFLILQLTNILYAQTENNLEKSEPIKSPKSDLNLGLQLKYWNYDFASKSFGFDSKILGTTKIAEHQGASIGIDTDLTEGFHIIPQISFMNTKINRKYIDSECLTKNCPLSHNDNFKGTTYGITIEGLKELEITENINFNLSLLIGATDGDLKNENKDKAKFTNIFYGLAFGPSLVIKKVKFGLSYIFLNSMWSFEDRSFGMSYGNAAATAQLTLMF